MKKKELLSLQRAGVFRITANNIDAAHAYKVLKFKKAGRKAFEELAESERAILEEVDIKEPEAFDKERAALAKSGSDPSKLEQMNKKLDRLVELRKALYEEEVELEGVKTVPYDQFHELQKENAEMPGKPLNVFEDLLEGILWEVPEES